MKENRTIIRLAADAEGLRTRADLKLAHQDFASPAGFMGFLSLDLLGAWGASSPCKELRELRRARPILD
jgi:hypothetical protein